MPNHRNNYPMTLCVGMFGGLLGGSVQSFVHLDRVDIGRGREELFRNQLPALLTELANRAHVASITASSALEGVVVADQARAAAIISGKAAVLRTRSEQELAGYRAALDYLFTSDWRPLNVGLLLHLHRELFADTNAPGGAFKESDNLVVDHSPDGHVEVRFVPVSAARTEFFTVELVDRYRDAMAAGEHHPVLLVLDLLTIHPFDDGNGRVVRALTNALLDDAGYTVGKYVSLEQLIAETADDYYEALLASTHDWHDGENDPWPWLTYFVTPGHPRRCRCARLRREPRPPQVGPGRRAGGWLRPRPRPASGQSTQRWRASAEIVVSSNVNASVAQAAALVVTFAGGGARLRRLVNTLRGGRGSRQRHNRAVHSSRTASPKHGASAPTLRRRP